MSRSPTAVMLGNGRFFDHTAPDHRQLGDSPLAIIELLGEVLNRIPRFGGHTLRTITVAEHSLRVARLARWIGGDYIRVPLLALLHDAHEAVMPWGDCLTPGKGPSMKAAEQRVDIEIAVGLEIHPWEQHEADIVTAADLLALYAEAMLWTRGGSQWAGGLLTSPAVKRFVEPTQATLEEVMRCSMPRAGEDWATAVRCELPRRQVRR